MYARVNKSMHTCVSTSIYIYIYIIHIHNNITITVCVCIYDIILYKRNLKKKEHRISSNLPSISLLRLIPYFSGYIPELASLVVRSTSEVMIRPGSILQLVTFIYFLAQL